MRYPLTIIVVVIALIGVDAEFYNGYYSLAIRSMWRQLMVHFGF
jgi:hypothetical protein